MSQRLAELSEVVAPLHTMLSGSIESGYSCSPLSNPTGHHVLSLTALSEHGYLPGQFKHAPLAQSVLDARLRQGDFLISRSNTIELVGFVGIFDEDRDDVSFPDLMMRMPLNPEQVVPRFLELVFQAPSGRAYIRKIAAGTSASLKKINRRNLIQFPVPVVDRERQLQVLAEAAHFDKNQRVVTTKLGASQRLKKHLLAHLLTPKVES